MLAVRKSPISTTKPVSRLISRCIVANDAVVIPGRPGCDHTGHGQHGGDRAAENEHQPRDGSLRSFMHGNPFPTRRDSIASTVGPLNSQGLRRC